ncbi:MAG: acyltransferase family protein [Deltaproteobacteria bacterium]|nr:acyltransferase family protein [Deltaproteobacteria bacterium]
MAARVASLDNHRRQTGRRAKTGDQQGPAAKARVARRPTAAPDGLERLVEFVHQLGNAVNPDVIARLNDEIAHRMHKVPVRLNRYGYDPWGFHVDSARRALQVTALFYRYYFRAEASGIEHLPPGRVLLIANHAGQIAIDGTMIATAAFLYGDPPRILRAMGEYWLPTVPFVSELLARIGSVVGTPKNCVDLLNNDEAVLVFPEGVRGMNKLFSQRYQLQEFGLGFVRLALETKTPIVPVAVVGSEEQAPAIANVRWLARLLGMPAFPVTLTWPWLGPLGLIPLPAKYRIYFGKPMRFSGNPHDEDRVIQRHVDKVKSAIQSMLERGLRERTGVFF